MKIRRRGMARINEEIDVIKFLRKSFAYNVLIQSLATEKQRNAVLRDGRFVIRGDKKKDEYAAMDGDNSDSENSEESFDAFN
jgi:hypothetical protein